MEMSGERSIPAARERVWAALNDPDVLRTSLTGCKSLLRRDDTTFRGTAMVRVGPVSASFSGDIKLLDVKPPSSYRIEASGLGGAAGFAKGSADVALTEASEGTLLSFSVKAEIGGKLAQLGTRLLDATAKQMTDQFFDRFTEAVTRPAPMMIETQQAPLVSVEPPTSGRLVRPSLGDGLTLFGLPPLFWVGTAIFLFIFVMMFGAYL
jgi:carbon monoxide dehydrogenase subunit G